MKQSNKKTYDFSAFDEAPKADNSKYDFSAFDEVSTQEVPEFKEQMGSLESAGLGALQGVSLGFSDEIEAAFKSGAISGAEYEAAKEAARQKYKSAEEQHPYLYGGGQVAGGITTAFVPGALGAKLAGATLGSAAGVGALTGIGQQEAPLSDLGETAKSAVIGGGAGVAGYGIGKGIASLLSKKATSASSSLQDTAEELAGKSVGLKKAQVLKEMGGKSKYLMGPDAIEEKGIAKEALEHIKPFQSSDELAKSTSSKFKTIRGEVSELVEQAEQGLKAKLGEVTEAPDTSAFSSLGVKSAPTINRLEKLGLSNIGDEAQTILNSVTDDMTKGGSASSVQGVISNIEPVIEQLRKNDGSIRGLMEVKDIISKNLMDRQWLISSADAPEKIALLRKFYTLANNRLETLSNIVSPDLGTTIRDKNRVLSNIIDVALAASEKEASGLTKQGVSVGDYAIGSLGAGIGGSIGGPPGAVAGMIAGTALKKGVETAAGKELPDIMRTASAKGFESLGKKFGKASELLSKPGAHIPFSKAASLAAIEASPIGEQSPGISSKALYSMNNKELQQITVRMRQANVRPDVADKLEKALASGDSAQKNSALFIIAQDPKLREALRIK